MMSVSDDEVGSHGRNYGARSNSDEEAEHLRIHRASAEFHPRALCPER
jgi:hypothetical protein